MEASKGSTVLFGSTLKNVAAPGVPSTAADSNMSSSMPSAAGGSMSLPSRGLGLPSMPGTPPHKKGKAVGAATAKIKKTVEVTQTKLEPLEDSDKQDAEMHAPIEDDHEAKKGDAAASKG